MFCGLGGGLVSPSSAGAAAPLKPVDVWLHDAYFQVAPDGPITPPTLVYAKPYQSIVFHLANPQNTHRSVTVDPADCVVDQVELCDKAFDDPNMRYDDPNNHTVKFRWETEGEYDFFDHYSPATGRFIISSADQTVQPAPPAPTTTTTMATTTTTMAPTTTTTAPTSIRPMLVPDPAPTTTTTRAANPAAAPSPAPASKTNDGGKDKAKKASSPSTPTTAAPAPDGTMPPDSVFDPAALTPAPTLIPAPDGSNGDQAAIDALAAASLLDQQKDGDDGSKLLLMAFGALVLMLMVGGGWAWFTRASRYDPA